MTVRLSRTKKLDGIRSWSLPAVSTCPGARGADGNLVPVCQGCYATTGNYRFPNVKEPREHNREDWKRDAWVDDMVAALENDRYFRWFDSGDIYHPGLAWKIFQVIYYTPWCHHWIPTRSHKIERIHVVLERIKRLPNVAVRYSADTVDGTHDPDLHGSVVCPSPTEAPAGVHVCPAYSHDDHRCNGCRACWDPNVAVVAYPAHGKKMFRILKQENLA